MASAYEADALHHQGCHAADTQPDNGVTDPDHTDLPDGDVRQPTPDAPPQPAASRWGPWSSMATRLFLLTTSLGGTVAACALWAGGHGGLAIRILAADIVLLAATLLAL